MAEYFNFSINTLGEPTNKSPINTNDDNFKTHFVNAEQKCLYSSKLSINNLNPHYEQDNLLEIAGPREKIFFNPEGLHAAIVTCGGLCPGINDVIRSLVMCLWYRYGVKEISGICNGYRGLLPEHNIPIQKLTPDVVSPIHRMGGSILGVSRGYGDQTEELVDALEAQNIKILFTIGGDGTQRAALNLHYEIKKRGLPISIIGIPKTIDNDIGFVNQSFGFVTAVSRAVESIAAAHTEAHDAINGIGIVKVMGRACGHIAANTALAMNDVNFVLIPEVPFSLEGKNGLLKHLENRLETRKHALILVAEGAGQDLLKNTGHKDLSGNKKLADIGLFLKESISAHFKNNSKEVHLKYIDPSYLIRSAPANPYDSIYCARLGNNAVHAAMSGRTGMMISHWNMRYVHVPLELVIAKRKTVSPKESLWRDVLALTGQPANMKS
ncbi:diphosphate--fructose-6-phosphate 1-phosphotransferase [bacterium K02(2017)]|nr:diphosphate--fructose-6-phosphate 1-phosphotransferase [bacterium K02(2017)]